MKRFWLTLDKSGRGSFIVSVTVPGGSEGQKYGGRVGFVLLGRRMLGVTDLVDIRQLGSVGNELNLAVHLQSFHLLFVETDNYRGGYWLAVL